MVSEKYFMNPDTSVNIYSIKQSKSPYIIPLSHFNPNRGLAGIIVCHTSTNFTGSLTITANGCGYNENEPISKTTDCDVFHL